MKPQKPLIKELLDVRGVSESLLDILDLFAHLLDQYF